MEHLTAENLHWFLVFVVPGFISMKVYDLFVPSPRRDFSKSILEVMSFSSINLAILYPFVGTAWDDKRSLLVLFIAPILWPVLYAWVSSWSIVRRHTLHPIAKPWDYVFSKCGPLWVIAHMKDGRRIGGIYDKRSFASSYPADEQLYLQEIWRLDETGAFKERVDRSRGILLAARDIDALEFFN
jgi:hypothetical protein